MPEMDAGETDNEIALLSDSSNDWLTTGQCTISKKWIWCKS